MVKTPLTADDVRRMTAGMVDPNYKPAVHEDSEPNYWSGEDREMVIAKLKNCEPLIFAMALRGASASCIAEAFGVSRECIAKRLRPAGFLNPKGVRGKPPEKHRSANRFVQIDFLAVIGIKGN